MKNKLSLKTILLLGIIAVLIPTIIALVRKFKAWIMTAFGFVSGEGNLSSQQLADLSQKTKNLIDQGTKEVKITAQDNIDAKQIADYNNHYRGFFSSMSSTNVPREQQIKALNLLGISVISDGKLHKANGSIAPLPGSTGGNLGSLVGANSVIDRKRIVRIIKAYGTKVLSDRQRFAVGFFLDNTEGTLPDHISNFYDDDLIKQTLPIINEALKSIS